MDRLLILETTFVVDLEREAAANAPGRAHGFLDTHPDEGLVLTVTTAGELACGQSSSARHRWEALLARFRVIAPDDESAWQYGQIYQYLKANGMLIGANDLWIAATALAHGLPVVTRDVQHYRRVPGLELVPY